MSLIAHRPASFLGLVLMLVYFIGLAAALIWLRLGPGLILALTAAVIALVVMSLRPYLALHCFLFLLFFENALGGTEGITAMKALGVVILAGWLASTLMRRRLGVSRSALLVALIAFLIWAGLCVPRALDAETGLVQFTSFFQMILAAVMFNSLIESPKHLRWILNGFVIWTVIATVIALVMYYAGVTPVAVGLTGNRNLLALYINIAMVCALLAFPNSPRPAQMGLALAVPILLLGMALTLSRTGMIMLGVVMLIAWYRLARHQGLLMLLGSAAALAGLAFLLPGAVWERAEGIVPTIERRADTFGLRLRIWEVGVRMIQDHPLMGVGTGSFIPASQRYARGEVLGQGLASHNMYIHVAAEMGVVGLALLMTIAALGLINAHRAFRRARDDGDTRMEMAAMAVEMMILVMIGQGLTGDVVQLKCFWVTFGLSLALTNFMRPAAATGREDAGPLAAAAPERAGA